MYMSKSVKDVPSPTARLSGAAYVHQKSGTFRANSDTLDCSFHLLYRGLGYYQILQNGVLPRRDLY